MLPPLRHLEEAGGDFYDVVPLGAGIIGYFVADISGHGVSAAFRGVDSVLAQMLGEEQNNRRTASSGTAMA
jgi:serine phosphatase RsbU (regulator of sigma subunit)